MRTTVILVVGCCLVLGGAFFASRMLVSEVPAPPAQVNVLTMVAPPPEVSAAPPAPTPIAPDRVAHEAAMMAAGQGQLQPVNPGPAAAYPRRVEAPTPAPAAPADVSNSPFKGESKELDYAELLLTDPNPDPEKLRSAYEVMSRCVDQEPDNQRCETGLALAKNLLSAPTTTELKPHPPTFVPQMPQTLRPALHPK